MPPHPHDPVCELRTRLKVSHSLGHYKTCSKQHGLGGWVMVIRSWKRDVNFDNHGSVQVEKAENYLLEPMNPRIWRCSLINFWPVLLLNPSKRA